LPLNVKPLWENNPEMWRVNLLPLNRWWIVLQDILCRKTKRAQGKQKERELLHFEYYKMKYSSLSLKANAL
jgi:hypothetical protein